MERNNKTILAILYLVLIAGFVFLGWRSSWFGLVKKSEEAATGTYQAVFLANGQVYFGKLSGTKGQYATLKEIYYLQSDKPIQAGQDTSKETPNLQLVKLGNELHGPVDEMKINRDHILFWENMKADSKVVQSIARFKSGEQLPAASATPTPTPKK